jgi:hypothetical protein
VSLSGNLCGQDALSWQKYKDSVAGLSLLFPTSDLLFHTDTLSTAMGDIEYHTVLHHSEEEKGVSIYKVSYCDYPKETIHHDSVELLQEFFKATVESSVESVDGELVYESSMQILGAPGMVWRINYNKGKAVLHSRAFVIDNRYYLIQSAAPRAYALSPEMETFFNSLRMIERSESTGD